MTVKRKRSTSAFSPFSPFSSASESSSSSPQRPHTLPISHTYQDTDTTMGDTHPFYQIDNWAPAGDQTPSHLHSRTRKRFRDGRPGESIIHENTYNLLFSAQRSPTPTPAHPRTPSLPSPMTTPPQHHQKRVSSSQSSLHNFWALPRRVSGHRQSSSSIPSQCLQLSCQDCDSSLTPTEGESAMDIDTCGVSLEHRGEDEREWACRDCGRVVCDGCAVVLVGEGRECLQCKTSRKRWVGGIGWM
ncbi:hypothetical protein MMC14_005636 [Varicellaria rhodocarpa]|nr:hypothetical protein [Varicellaria rhodocarpa]